MADVGATTEHGSLKVYSIDESGGAKGIELLSTVSQERRPIRYKILLIHCKSRDNDLGVHNLTVGNEFMWKFKPAIFGSTLFYCFMASEFDHVHATFNVFWDNQDLFYWCNWKLCSWIGEDDGIYLKNIPEKYGEFNHKWESGRELHANYTIV
ncbi:hypothetical protein V6N11_024836 [Hibiscus sabdariffa]|uniref:S-protein homolog n=1 Tax=Hibiscus sabdariffa TaxID=183260 RepID=A0ABR2QN94_9ROSI